MTKTATFRLQPSSLVILSVHLVIPRQALQPACVSPKWTEFITSIEAGQVSFILVF